MRSFVGSFISPGRRGTSMMVMGRRRRWTALSSTSSTTATPTRLRSSIRMVSGSTARPSRTRRPFPPTNPLRPRYTPLHKGTRTRTRPTPRRRRRRVRRRWRGHSRRGRSRRWSRQRRRGRVRRVRRRSQPRRSVGRSSRRDGIVTMSTGRVRWQWGQRDPLTPAFGRPFSFSFPTGLTS